MAPAALQAPFASLPEASDAADAWFATAPEWVTGVHVEVQLTSSTVATYRLSRNGSVRRITEELEHLQGKAALRDYLIATTLRLPRPAALYVDYLALAAREAAKPGEERNLRHAD